MNRNDKAIARVKCPKCKQPKGQPCVYVPVTVPRYAYWASSPKTLERQARVGQPTKVPHNERRTQLWALERYERAKELHARQMAGSAEPPSLQEIRVANATALRRETEQLVAWLREHGSILWS